MFLTTQTGNTFFLFKPCPQQSKACRIICEHLQCFWALPDALILHFKERAFSTSSTCYEVYKQIVHPLDVTNLEVSIVACLLILRIIVKSY